MYGAEGRIGLMVPSVNTVVEPEFGRLVPSTIGVYAARMRNSRADTQDSKAMLGHVERAADELGSARVGVLAFACTASSFVDGDRGEVEVRRRMESAARAPAITTSGAVAEALNHLGARKILVCTPYVAELNELEKAYLQGEGFEIVGIEGMGILEAFDIGKVEPEETGEFVLEVWRRTENGVADTDAVFISCTNLRTIEVLPALSDQLGRPVISSNSATCWACLRALARDEQVAEGVLTGTNALLPAQREAATGS